MKKLIYLMFDDAVHTDSNSKLFVDNFVEEVRTGSRCYKAKRIIPKKFTDEELQRLTVPTLFIVGENEKIYSAQKAVERFNTIAPDVKTEIINGAGHDVTVVQADTINQKYLRFSELIRTIN